MSTGNYVFYDAAQTRTIRPCRRTVAARIRYYAIGWAVLGAVLLIAAVVRVVTGRWPR